MATTNILFVNDTKKVRKYCTLGGYPIFYVSDNGNAICPDCVQEDQDLDKEEQELCITGHVVNWEDASLFCDQCNKRIESAYAEDEATS
ncbi:MAG: hypothetical protein DRN14_05915 [Thermoplasmata archaeon]|nr:MAG: hypothetical protein DRN14_05915 [Thermoplasmata archaeon]